MGGRLPVFPERDAALRERWAEFTSARLTTIPQSIEKLLQNPQYLPDWVELQGIFRYVHPLDGPEKRQEQMEECEKARQRALRGESFAAIARRMSQGGSRTFGGILHRRYLTTTDPVDTILAGLGPGQISPVIRVANGYWCYRVRKKRTSNAMLSLAQIPWPARRVLFRRMLAETGRASRSPAEPYSPQKP